MTTWSTTSYSDDCASFCRDGVPLAEPDESMAWGRWWPMYVDGELVAHVMTTYGDGWEFHIRSARGASIKIEFPEDAEYEEGLGPDED